MSAESVHLQRAAPGRLEFNRPPRLRSVLSRQRVHLPALPLPASAPTRGFASGLLMPLITVAATGSGFLLFALLNPGGDRTLMITVAAAGGGLPAPPAQPRRGAGGAARRGARHPPRPPPDPQALIQRALSWSRRLWERRPEDTDFLQLRLGLGLGVSQLEVVRREATTESEFERAALQLAQRYELVPDVPIVADLRATTAVGLTGPYSRSAQLARTSTSFSITGRPLPIQSLLLSDGTPLQPGATISQPTWLQPQAAESGPIDSAEWTIDGKSTQVDKDPYALLLDPEQLGDGRHDLSVRLTSGGRPGPSYTTSISVPFDMLRSVRAWLRSWGAVASVLVLINALIATFVVVALARRRGTSPRSEFVPTLQLRPTNDGLYVGPSVIEFPPRGKLRIGYHPPFKDNDVGSREFASLPHCDIRGDDEAVKELSRHVACIWRDEKTNDCYIQLGWAGPGEPIRPKAQTQVLHFGRPQDATSEPFRLAHRDVVRLAPRVEYVFTQVGLRDKPTPERKKTESFSPTSTAATPVDRALSMPRLALLEAERRRLSGEVVETLDED